MKLEKIETAKAKTGAVYWILTIDAKKYNLWAEPKGVSEGDFVTCEFETKGAYTNLKSIVKASGNGSNAQIQQAIIPTSNIVITRSEKPHSYEFGKPNNRHKIYYNDVAELKDHIAMLELAGYIGSTDFIEEVKI